MAIPDWKLLHPRMKPEYLGYIPFWLNDKDKLGAAEQIHRAYGHGGGWLSAKGFTMDRSTGTLNYPGDMPLKPLAMCRLRDEVVYFYDHSWVAVVQPNGSFDVARID